MDNRKQRIMMAIVSLYGAQGEPVGSNLLCKHLDISVSSATLRNEMAALTRLGMLEQPHTSAGRVPTAKGYRYYVDNLLDRTVRLSAQEKALLDSAFRTLDYDPEQMVQGAARLLSEHLGYAVIATTPRAEDITMAHFEVLQVGRHAVAVLGVTRAGGVRTRVVKVDCELSPSLISQVAQQLNRHLCFVASADVHPKLLQGIFEALGSERLVGTAIVSAALTLLAEAGRPKVYFEGQKNLLHRPEMENALRTLIELADAPERVERLLKPKTNHTQILFGDEMPHSPMHSICLVSRRYLAGGGLTGVLSVAGPIRMPYRSVIPDLEYFSALLGQGLSGNMAG